MGMKNLVFIGVVLAGAAVIGLVSGFFLIWRIVFIVLFLVLLSGLWNLLNGGGTRVRTKAPPETSQVGDILEQEFTIVNYGKLPRFLLKLRTISSLGEPQETTVTNLLPGDAFVWRPRVLCRRRGLHEFGKVEVGTGDPFGFFQRHRTMGQASSIVIHPRTVELPYFSLTGDSQSAMLAHRLTNQYSANVAGIREYAAGDTLRHVHWPSTVHAGKMMVKQFDAERPRDDRNTIWIVCDMYGATHAGLDEESTEEYGITVAASLAKKYAALGWSVGLVSSGKQLEVLPPARGEDQLKKVMTALSLATRGKRPIDDVLSAQDFGAECAVVGVSPDVERIITPLRRLAARENVVAAVLLDAASFGGGGMPVHQVGWLLASGVQTYVVHNGDSLSRALGGYWRGN